MFFSDQLYGKAILLFRPQPLTIRAADGLNGRNRHSRPRGNSTEAPPAADTAEAEQGPPYKFSSGVSARAGNLENGSPLALLAQRSNIYKGASPAANIG